MPRSDHSGPQLELYSTTVAVGAPNGMLTIFHAMLASGPEQVLARIAERLGTPITQLVAIERGFDPANPFAQMLVSDEMRKLLCEVASDPGSPLIQGFELLLDHRLGGAG
ncbi:MAG TPA: hypothetical protein VF680_07520 [Allosphingosinicella sp.]|jgi:hypothetical protein